jgi:arginine/ornithine transport system substrate-binding protein
MIRSSAGSGGGHPGAALHTGFGALGETPNPAAILRPDSQRTIRRRLTSLVLMIAALQERSIDAIISDMMVNRDREQLVDFTDIYRNVENRFVARRHASLDISPEGLAGKKLGVKRNTVHDRYITDKYGATAIIRRYSDVVELFVDLALGRNDAILAEVAPARVSFLQTPLGADNEFVGPEISNERWLGTGIGIAVRKGDNARREALNHALVAIRAHGTYQRIIAQYSTPSRGCHNEELREGG